MRQEGQTLQVPKAARGWRLRHSFGAAPCSSLISFWVRQGERSDRKGLSKSPGLIVKLCWFSEEFTLSVLKPPSQPPGLKLREKKSWWLTHTGACANAKCFFKKFKKIPRESSSETF